MTMNLGDIVEVTQKVHQLFPYHGKVIGKRGARGKDDTLILVYITDTRRSHLIPESFLRLKEITNADKRLPM